MLLVRLPRCALDTPALKAFLRKALASGNGAIRETGGDLMGNDA